MTSSKYIKTERGLLTQALRDLNNELKVLQKSRRFLERKMEKFTGNLGVTQQQEIKLRNEISSLMKKEHEIIKNIAGTKDRFQSVGKRIEKIKGIERELKEV